MLKFEFSHNTKTEAKSKRRVVKGKEKKKRTTIMRTNLSNLGGLLLLLLPSVPHLSTLANPLRDVQVMASTRRQRPERLRRYFRHHAGLGAVAINNRKGKSRGSSIFVPAGANVLRQQLHCHRFQDDVKGMMASIVSHLCSKRAPRLDCCIEHFQVRRSHLLGRRIVPKDVADRTEGGAPNVSCSVIGHAHVADIALPHVNRFLFLSASCIAA